MTLLFSFCLSIPCCFAQSKPAKEKPPTQKEMQEMMKEAQKELNNMSAEDKKMMDSMGFKMPNMKSIQKKVSGVSDAQLKKAFEDDMRIVPQKDDARIAAIFKPLAEADIAAYINSIQNKMALLLNEGERSMCQNIYRYIQSNSKNSNEAGNMAIGLWIAGTPATAMFTLGKICTTTPGNTDNLSNYAAMLSMMGGQHLAIPLLNHLNKKFPQNSTLLNNLGQAWLGLGELTKSEKYLDSAIRFFANHPQAKLTKAAIEESKGNIAKAIAALKISIKHSYTTEKEDRLRKLGYEMNIKDISLPFKPGTDPLGLADFRRPEYPTTLSQLISLKPLWEKFNNDCAATLAKLQVEQNAVYENYAKDISSMKLNLAKPLHIKKASLNLNEIKTFYENKFKRLGEQHKALTEELQQIDLTRKRAAPEAPCEAHLEAENDYIKKYNEKKKAFDEEFLEVSRHFYNDMAYWSQYTSISKTQFELVVLEFKTDWITKLKEYQPLLSSDKEQLECAAMEKAIPGKLSDFDVVACNYNDTMDLKVIVFYQNCSRMTSKLNLKFVEYTRYDNFLRAEGDTYMSSTIKLSVEKGFDKLKGDYGPLKLEAKIGAAIELEFDREGLKDVTLSVEAKAGIGHNTLDQGLEAGGSIAGKDVIDTTVEIGVEGRISIISGKGAVKGTGMLENIIITQWQL